MTHRTLPATALRALAFASALAVAACSADKAASDTVKEAAVDAPAATKPSAPAITPAAPPAGEPIPEEAQIPADTVATAFGKGSLERSDGKMASFTVDVNFRPGNVVSGTLTYTTFLDDGKIDLVANVTCGHYNVDSQRAWFGGQISENKSNKVDAKGGRYAVGQPVWFRFEESNEHPATPAKVSDLGLAGDGYASGQAFCDDQSWSEDGLRDLSAQGAVIIFALPAGMGGQ